MKSPERFAHFCRDSLGLSESVFLDITALERRGSDRAFFRVKWEGDRSAILIHYDPKRVENTYYAGIASFLREIDIPVPRPIRHDPEACLLMMEDLGRTDLWSLRETSWGNRCPLYQKTLKIVHRLQSISEKVFPSGRIRLMEGFGPDVYRWERDYFRKHFVRDFCGTTLEPSFERELESELSGLAERLSGAVRCLVHRDLQSQNVMVLDGEPFLIDFQGMRFGNPFYDLGSLLCDPYVNLLDSERDELLSFSHRLSNGHLDEAAWQDHFWEASAQRLMQALGAYGFLGLTKGLKDYLQPIPAGVRNLQRAAAKAFCLPRLNELSSACRVTVEQRVP